MSMYDEPIVFRAALYLDDGDDPMAGGDADHEGTDAEAVRQWALGALEAVELATPAPAGGRWYATLERGHYERTGSTGFDEIDCDWTVDESFDPLFSSATRRARA